MKDFCLITSMHQIFYTFDAAATSAAKSTTFRSMPSPTTNMAKELTLAFLPCNSFSTVTSGFLVDSMSYQYLVGAEIDYIDSFEGSQFTIKNPQAKTTCGCGSSFSV